VENDKSPLNRALAAELRAERVAVNITVDQLSDRSGVNLTTLKRVLAGKRDINVTQLGLLSQALGVTAEELFRRAVTRMGGMGALMSEVQVNNVHVLKSVDQFDTDELDASVAQAALRDREMNEDEQYH
jgi:transcriptional regulator with XRE-family HTH domain